MTGWVIFGQPVRGRSCGSCTACCTQVPVDLPSGLKPANTRCRHLRSSGCSIYASRPRPCEYWSCRWLFDDTTADMRRPDHAGYIVDSMLDTVLVNGKPVEVIQIWCDPKRRDAHRDPALRAWLDDVGRVHGLHALVRWSSEDGKMLFPPSLCEDKEWHEMSGDMLSKETMDAKLELAGGRPNYQFEAR